MHHHHKRAMEEYHVIPIQQLQSKILAFYNDVNPLVISVVQDIIPSVYVEFEAHYLPTIKEVKNDLMLFLYEKVWPQVQNSVSYVRNVVGRLIKKAYETYELSHSTHITIVTMSYIANDVSNELKSVIQMGKFMLSRFMAKHSRIKRSTINSIPSLLSSIIQPAITNIVSSVASSVIGEENSLTNKLILPNFFRMIDDAETRLDFMKVKKFHAFTIVTKILNKHLSMVLYLASQDVPTILQSIAGLKGTNTGVLRDSILNFVIKHKSLLQTSDSRHVNTYSLTKIKKDLTPIYMSLLQVGISYMSNNKGTLTDLFFSQGSFLNKSPVQSPVSKPSWVIANRPISVQPSRAIPRRNIRIRNSVYRVENHV